MPIAAARRSRTRLPAAPRLPRLIRRAAWGADESLRFDPDGAEIWPRGWTDVRRLVVHHTSTPNDESDPAARVRAIYEFHALERGWGDIGYHLLVDEAGNLYEGRSGAAGTLDAAPGVIGAHVYGHNAGTLGVALIGTLTDQRPTAPALATAVALLGALAYRHGIDPGERWSNAGGRGSVPTICAHRDLGATSCPGDACYEAMPELRIAAAAAVRAHSGRPSEACR